MSPTAVYDTFERDGEKRDALAKCSRLLEAILTKRRSTTVLPFVRGEGAPMNRERITRRTADRLLAECVLAAEVINGSPKFAYSVGTLVLFGSHLTNRSKIGDVDVAIRLRIRNADPAKHEALQERIRKTAPRSWGWADRLVWPEMQVVRRLRARSPYLRVHELAELGQILARGSVPYRVLMGEWNGAPVMDVRHLPPVGYRWGDDGLPHKLSADH